MATPLYKKMKDKSVSFYSFPSAAEDITLAYQNEDYKMNFSKFVLLNLPKQDLTNDIFDFRDAFYTDDINNPTKYSEQLIQSLRNYVANQDVNIRQAKINSNTDFYNINEPKTIIEKIFWKWLRKLNVIDFEPAVHKVDWDKNLSDFKNPNNDTVANSDYFRKYLWKERDVINYKILSIEPINSTQSTITIEDYCKFRADDIIFISGYTGGIIGTGVTQHVIDSVSITTSGTVLTIHTQVSSSYYPTNAVCYLKYNKVVQYIGEINAMSKVQTSKSNYSEITAFIPHQAGKTPTVLWDLHDDTNYRPNLEIPFYSTNIQTEILGAENLNSPIRTTPANYGPYYGQFDTNDKTYISSNGDKMRYSGDYYGIKLTNNVGLSDNNYFEKLDDFNGKYVDGLNLDFNTKHYLKMNLPDYVSKNFDEFNAMPINNVAPADFEFNAILWYYEIDDGQGNITKNLYGISFLNNPENDDDDSDVENTLITPYKKYVSNGNQDGLSYTFDLNITYEVDNDMVSPNFDPSAVHNMFGFDLYNNVLSTLGKLQENFINITNQFITINQSLNDMRSLIYSQTDMDYIKTRLENFDSLLQLYATNQFVNSDTAEVETDYTGIYPAVKFNVIDLEYKTLEVLNTSDIYLYNITNSGSSSNILSVIVPDYNKKLLTINNNDLNGVNYILNITLNNDLKYKQEFDILIKPQKAYYSKILNINMMYDDGINGSIETSLITGIPMPIDLSFYDPSNGSIKYNRTHYCDTNVTLYIDSVYTTGLTNQQTALFTSDSNVFNTNEYVFVHNFYFSNTDETIIDLSGLYKIVDNKQPYIVIEQDIRNLTLVGIPTISFYKGLKIKILRITDVDSTGVDTSSIADRYYIEKTYL